MATTLMLDKPRYLYLLAGAAQCLYIRRSHSTTMAQGCWGVTRLCSGWVMFSNCKRRYSRFILRGCVEGIGVVELQRASDNMPLTGYRFSIGDVEIPTITPTPQRLPLQPRRQLIRLPLREFPRLLGHLRIPRGYRRTLPTSISWLKEFGTDSGSIHRAGADREFVLHCASGE